MNDTTDSNRLVMLELSGSIGLEEFTSAVQQFGELVSSLSADVAGNDVIEWGLEVLRYASPAVMTWRGSSEDLALVDVAISAIEDLAQQVDRGEPLSNYPKSIQANVEALLRIPNGKIDLIRFGSESVLASVVAGDAERADLGTELPRIWSYGNVRGYADGLKSRARTVTIIDDIYERSVSCQLDEDHVEQMRSIWEHKVSIIGLVQRDGVSGRPIRVTDITSIEILPEPAPFDFHKLKGIIAWKESDEPAEVTIRRLRDDF